MNWFTELVVELTKFFIDIIKLPFSKPMQPEQPTPEPIPVTSEPAQTISNRERLYQTAKNCLGTDASPNDVAPDEYGCAETVNEIYKKAFGHHIVEPGISTNQLYHAMLAQADKFLKVYVPMYGDIIISPTGYGTNPNMPNGHTGIVAMFGIMSNDSYTGKFEENYTLAKWNAHYHDIGGYPVVFFRCV